MLKIQEIREIIKLVDQSSIDEFVFEHEGSKIQMKKNTMTNVQAMRPLTQTIEAVPVAVESKQTIASAVQVQEPVSELKEEVSTVNQANLHKITSPMVGTFYASSSPDAEAYVKPGSKVSKDSIVCIVEAMKLFNEIEAEVDGEIVEILVKNGQLVEYGQPLFLVKPE